MHTWIDQTEDADTAAGDREAKGASEAEETTEVDAGEAVVAAAVAGAAATDNCGCPTPAAKGRTL